MKMTTDNYIQIPNVAFGFGTEYKLNDDELKVFAYLQFAKQVGTMVVRTNIEIIIEDLNWETTSASRDKKKVAMALSNLSEKGYITITFKEGAKNDVKKDNFTVTINDVMKSVEVKSEVDWKQKPFTFKGYTEIKASEYNLAEKNDYHLMVMAYYNWRNNAQFEYAICDKEWCEVLELGMTRTREIINDCTFLTKVSGKKYQDENGQWKQETNQYVKSTSVKPDLKEIETENKNLTILEKEREKVTDENVLLDDDVFKQIFDKNTFIKFKGYKAWKETTCDHVKKAGQKKFEILEKAGQSWVGEKLENEYQENLRSKEIINRMIETQMNDFRGYEEFQPSYKPKKIEENNFFDDM
ncbi:TPA: hypothetical protein QCY65_000703 [Bacillus cereus]|uniref:hypothetical protein n=1 Tax=Bacillus thuringiensis TaxID=1428 RepID=UPI000BFDB83C|nr:hypothetical protein [Bacillus thuringiensis]PGR77756.1 hypothetical protein COC43_12645 [Bacillus thuringiensis]HDR8016490.1 hypothetical protein [Bacillus cereus]